MPHLIGMPFIRERRRLDPAERVPEVILRPVFARVDSFWKAGNGQERGVEPIAGDVDLQDMPLPYRPWRCSMPMFPDAMAVSETPPSTSSFRTR